MSITRASHPGNQPRFRTILLALCACAFPSCAPPQSPDAPRTVAPVNSASQKSGDEPRLSPVERLFEAIYKGDQTTVQSLLQRGVSIEARNQDGHTPLIFAASNLKLEIARMLLDRGANINAANNMNLTPLTAALQEYDMKKTNHAPSLDTHAVRTLIFLLIARGADVNRKVRGGDSALIFAVEAKDRELVRLLVRKGADVNASGEYLKTPLYAAVYSQDLDTVKLLLNHKANQNAWESGYNSFRTILMVAVDARNLQLVKMLLKYGASVNAEGRYGINALDTAIVNKDQRMIKLLKQACAKSGNIPSLKRLRQDQKR